MSIRVWESEECDYDNAYVFINGEYQFTAHSDIAQEIVRSGNAHHELVDKVDALEREIGGKLRLMSRMNTQIITLKDCQSELVEALKMAFEMLLKSGNREGLTLEEIREDKRVIQIEDIIAKAKPEEES